MDLFAEVKSHVLAAISALAAEGRLPEGLDLAPVTVEPPRDPAHGDMATNAAMVLARPAGMPPRDLAAALAERLRNVPGIVSVEVAGPGFLNLRLAPDRWTIRNCGRRIEQAGNPWAGFGRRARSLPRD